MEHHNHERGGGQFEKDDEDGIDRRGRENGIAALCGIWKKSGRPPRGSRPIDGL
jgi:hypothetical protein